MFSWATKRGRDVRKNGTNSADFAFEVRRSPTSQDNILRRLDEGSEELEERVPRQNFNL